VHIKTVESLDNDIHLVLFLHTSYHPSISFLLDSLYYFTSALFNQFYKDIFFSYRLNKFHCFQHIESAFFHKHKILNLFCGIFGVQNKLVYFLMIIRNMTLTVFTNAYNHCQFVF